MNIRVNLTLPETGVHAEHFCSETMGLPSLCSTQLFSENPRKKSRRTCAKNRISRNERIFWSLKSRQKPESLAYIFAADSTGLSSFNFCGWLRNMHHFCNRMRIGRSRSSKVVDFGTNWKGVCDLLLVINSNFDHILHRFWDTATYWPKIANFPYPTLI